MAWTMSTDTPCASPERCFQISAAASALAAIEACAAAATRNDDGTTGFAPVSVTASSADGAPPARCQRSAKISRGDFMSDYRHCEEPTGPRNARPDDRLRDEAIQSFAR